MNVPEQILETERLRLRPFTTSDTAFIRELVNTPGWLRYIGDRQVHSDEDAVRYLENGPMKGHREHGHGLSKVETKDGTPIGMCGVLKRDTMEHPDLGFAFLPEWEGKGLAFEIAAATLRHARETLGLGTIDAITLPANERSVRLLERLGMQRVGILRMPGDNEELLLYRSIHE